MSHELVGVVSSISNGKTEIAPRNNLRTGDKIEFLSTGLENRTFEVNALYNEKGIPVESGRNEESVLLPIQQGVRENDLIRRPLRHSA